MSALLMALLATGAAIAAQHAHEPPAAPLSPAATPPGGAAERQQQHEAAPRLFSARDASGTSWLPDATPMYGFHDRFRGWEAMLHGSAFLQFLGEDAPEHRGAAQAGSINWIMAMGRRSIGQGRVGLRAMLSFEPWTIAGCGYPNLLATGESCDGDSIHDRQHPHDLFMELAGEFDRPLTGTVRWQLYGGAAGEPALGPPAFPHRISTLGNPLSPIAHHWLDSTHITYGVITSGVYGVRWKAEASAFNGREPDERRYDFDFGALDSVAGRLWLLPNESLALQVSAGHLKEAERIRVTGPSIDADRFTASATYHRLFGNGHLWATTLAWGANREQGTTTHGGIAESSLSLSAGHTWFGRGELNGKPGHDLHVHELPNDVFVVGKLQGGYARYFRARAGLTPGIGASMSAALVPRTLRPRYGGVGIGVGIFLTLRPAPHQVSQ